MRILIVEDDLQIAKMYQYKLENANYNIKLAENGKNGLEIAKDFKPDLILLDLLMPIMDGSEMLQNLRSYDWGKNIKVIVLTNISKDEAPHNLRFLNVTRYIVKAHYTPRQVLDIINHVMDSK